VRRRGDRDARRSSEPFFAEARHEGAQHLQAIVVGEPRHQRRARNATQRAAKRERAHDVQHFHVRRLHLVEHFVDGARSLEQLHELALEFRGVRRRRFGGDEGVAARGELGAQPRHLVELAHRLHHEHRRTHRDAAQRGRAARHECEAPVALAEQAVERLLPFETPVHGVEHFSLEDANFAGARGRRHRKHARAPVHRKHLQQIDERDLRQIAAHFTLRSLDGDRARRRRHDLREQLVECLARRVPRRKLALCILHQHDRRHLRKLDVGFHPIGELARMTDGDRGEDDVGVRLFGALDGGVDVVGEQHGEAAAAQRGRQLAEGIEIRIDEKNPARQLAPFSPRAARPPSGRSAA
jgi:hypothetical protein